MDIRPRKFDQWKKGETGVPIIDAGMRELYNTGYMNNRARLIVASYLTDYLQIHWKYGVGWFKETLFDADKANNAASWQWVAGSGADPVDYQEFSTLYCSRQNLIVMEHTLESMYQSSKILARRIFMHHGN